MEMYQQVAYITGIVFGGLIIGSICIVFIKKCEITRNSIIFGVLGILLLGMSIWSSIDVKVSSSGIDLSFIKDSVKELEKQHEMIAQDMSTIEGHRQDMLYTMNKLKKSINEYEGKPLPKKTIVSYNRHFQSVQTRNKDLSKKLDKLRSRSTKNREKIIALRKALDQ